MRCRRHLAAPIAIVALALLASGCSGGSSSTRASGGSVRVRPDGPAASFSAPLTGGSGPVLGAAVTAELRDAGYVEREMVASGTATSYTLTDSPRDGHLTVAAADTAEYRTRVIVRAPADPARFDGTAIVEWLNVSGGIDAAPDYSSTSAEILRSGAMWVGVSAQRIGVEGGPVLVSVPGVSTDVGKGLKAIDPDRYGSLVHPGDGYAFDIYSQVARAVLAGGEPVGGLTPSMLLAVGESQSAIALTSYYDAFQPITELFDGFLIHSRASVGLPFVGPGQSADLAGGMRTAPILVRDDLSTPVLEVQSEGDVAGVLDSLAVRQPDTASFRLWEVAGTAHADRYLLGPIADTADCGAPINDGPLHLVVSAALRALDTWARTGEAPPSAALLELAPGTTAVLARDADGIAVGGVRTPSVDVPTQVLSGQPGPDPKILCLLLGSTLPMTAERLQALYPSNDAYDAAYRTAADQVIAAGFVLPEDRDALLASRRPPFAQG